MAVPAKETGNRRFPTASFDRERGCFLSQPDVAQRVAFELAAYVLITYRPSLLDPELAPSAETIIATPLTDPGEVRALAAVCGAANEAEWARVLGGLGIDEGPCSRAP
ncbi:MAG: hypothetical protein ABI680_00990 [Chthoniobacteraceae bacterium]